MSVTLNDRIEKLKGVGERRAKLYHKLGVDTIYSLLQFYPRTYLDYSKPVPIADTIINDNNVILATVFRKQGEKRIRKGLSVFKVYVNDGMSNLIITIFNSKWQYEALKEGEQYYFYGKVTGTLLKREMTAPLFVTVEEGDMFRPIYSLTEGLTNKMIQTNVKEALEVWGDCLDDAIPNEIKMKHNLCHLRYAIENIHFPKDEEALQLARFRLMFEELLVLQLGLILLRNKVRTETGIMIKDCDMVPFYESLPFTLTNGQQQAINEGLADMKRNIPMNRLCQGDVGCGKTMVAAALSYACHHNGFQSAIMAPTQILAEQHYETLSNLLTPLGIHCCLLTGSQKASEKAALLEGIENGEYSVVIGTHALVQDTVVFRKLGLVVTDEQHRFGVSQRAKLANKGDNPHLLVMSATPIPRTLALIIYGDLDVSVIKELPKGRKPIETYAIGTDKRLRALSFIKKHIDQGRQAYIVCPLIEESESDLISIQEYIKGLQKSPLSNYRIAALNGKLKGTEKEAIMGAFKRNEIQVLVSTTVVEVGVDVPNANIMLIENAERFGLSQLHQLRGRVGRGEYQSFCILVSDHQGEENKKRLQTMTKTNDGFLIAEEDLKLRGPGDFFGVKQHGLPALKIANLVDNMDMLHMTQEVAKEILESDSKLQLPEHRGLRNEVKRLFYQNEQRALN
ncbi:ATP-dependent DNA helicase RecG [Paludicola sp. MB14-C6]|uniref:ATP-dependent DNA helicase RecG n=1 Tax=Paludihabitans sp. MB14-C6 TaxID=3070656 RepID=UPI0027DCE644|nr:ATP-dependent DNA helicase RecG [Paludicola sp. MB14-C6]WMJ21998.1 ATP-dependent DNA helicase RecG [Paludicola sp. MB14-C6]